MPKRHRQSQRNGTSHQRSGTPVPETDQCDDDDEHNGLVETRHQQTDKVLHLFRLVRRASKNEVGRQLRAHGGKRLIYRFAEFADLLS